MMQWMAAKITFFSNNDDLAADLIADVFYRMKVKGVVIDDPLLELEEKWVAADFKRPSRAAVTGYLPADDHYEHRRHTLERSIARLAADYPFDYAIAYAPVDEEDWAEAWKAYFWPLKITPRIVIKPTWREYQRQPDQLIIEIDPGMAFGTGAHPTTSLCVQLLEHHLPSGAAVLDVGTGSGILLIAAAKLGAVRLTGVDADPLAVEVARRNLNQNKIDPAMVDVATGDLVQAITGTYDVVVANILAEVIIDLLDDVLPLVNPGGLFICSGIIEASQGDVLDKMTRIGFEVVDKRQAGEWFAFAGMRPSHTAQLLL
jgi:ribosomal protein L11 methyltransferase